MGNFPNFKLGQRFFFCFFWVFWSGLHWRHPLHNLLMRLSESKVTDRVAAETRLRGAAGRRGFVANTLEIPAQTHGRGERNNPPLTGLRSNTDQDSHSFIDILIRSNAIREIIRFISDFHARYLTGNFESSEYFISRSMKSCDLRTEEHCLML